MQNNHSRTLTHSVAAALVAVFSIVSVAPASAVAKRPSLVVGIMVDGLSMDYIELLRDQFGDNGLKRLLQQGLLINDLDYGTALDPAAATAVVFTGAAPQVNGIPAATVYDRDTRRSRSVLFDASKIGNFTDETLSPAAITSSTLADELRIDGGGTNYAYAIAADPVQAIIMAGHAGNSAFWINDHTGRWATTTYYKDLPSSPQEANRRLPLERRLDTLQWVPSIPVDRFPDLPAHKKLYPFRNIFQRGDANRFRAYKNSPVVNADVAAMAADYIRLLKLGSRESTDMLSLGLTVEPYIYGREPDSRLELMDSYLRLDRDLATLFDAIDRQGPGMDRTVVFVAGTPLTRRQRRDDEKWAVPYGEFSSRKAVSLLNMYLMAVHGNGEWVSGYHNGQIYLNHKLIKERGKDLEEMCREAASFLTRMAGVSQAWTVDDVIDRRATDSPDATRRNTALASAGDIFLAIAPGWQEIDDDSDVETPQTVVRAGMATAPAFILAPSLAPKEVQSPVDARVLAPTVAGILRIRAPNGASMPRLRP